MNTLDKIKALMEEKGIKSYAELARLSNLPRTTVTGLFVRGAETAKIETIVSIAKGLNVKMCELLNVEKKENTESEDVEMTFEESEIVRRYREASEKTQGIIQGLLMQDGSKKNA